MSTLNLKNSYNSQLEKEDFFSVVQHYEKRFLKACKEAGIEAHSLGEDGSPASESIRFKSKNSLALSLNDIKSIDTDNHYPEKYEYLISFMGLLGSAGILPQHYTKLSLERFKKGDTALGEFLGMFEHRLISLYYKSIGKYKLPIQYHENTKEAVDNVSFVLKSFSGYFNNNLAQLYYAGHYSKKNRSVSNLQAMLKGVVGAEVFIKSMVGQWLPIRENDRCKIGVSGKNHHLPSGIILGKRYWDMQSAIRIIISEITLEEYKELRPGQKKYQLLVATINTYLPSHIDVFLEFRVKTIKAKLQRLGKGFQLSNNSWIMRKPKDILISKRKLKK